MNMILQKLNMDSSKLKDIFLNSILTQDAWIFHDNTISMDILYTIYRKIILESLIPLACISGINFQRFVKMQSSFNLSNYSSINESFFTIFRNIQCLVYPPNKTKSIIVTSNTPLIGDITSNNLNLSDGSIYFEPLIKDTFICHTNQPIKIQFCLTTDIGQNTATINGKEKYYNKTFIPVPTSHSLYPLITPISFDNSKIYHTISNKIVDLEKIKKVIIDFLFELEDGNEKEEAFKTAMDVREIFLYLFKKASRYGKAINCMKVIFENELRVNSEYIKIKDRFFYENMYAKKNGISFPQNSDIVIEKQNFEFELFSNLFLRKNEKLTMKHLSELPNISMKSAEEISSILYEFII